MAGELQGAHLVGQIADLQLVGQGEERTGNLLIGGEAVDVPGQHVTDDDLLLRRRWTAGDD